MRRKKKDSLGLFQVLLFTTFFYLWTFVDTGATGTHTLHAETASLPFRPIGSASAVDQYSRAEPNPRGNQNYGATQNYAATPNDGYNQNAQNVRYIQTGFRADPRNANAYGNVRQVAMQSGGFALPSDAGGMTAPDQYTPPPLNTPPNLLPGSSQQFGSSQNLQPAPPTIQPQLSPPPSYNVPGNNAALGAETAPRSLPSPGTQSYPSGPIADYQPVAPPQLSNGGFATMSDCRLITPASSYSAMSPYGDTCGCGSVAPTSYAGPYIAPPAQIAAPAAMPTYAVPPASAATAAPVGSLVTFGQETYPVQVGQGLWGQPVAYVPGQRFRNWLRYFSF
ncbi:hypothetical protein [Aporhodopirellula aestuarii]|uniref:Uncharacterized protein n=1 Tax=Aporhodopirellula aestuarii TaxID=2950107 RepID=A0ABT0UCA3_9BACT|nr:hypothetical protein [Aporhodopirellula aestuarii]MCM2374405.1 hypothetical protein [Aporhodopirellula aestuarii]